MEKLKSVIPESLKRKISESSTNDLNSTCSSLLDFYQNLPLFHEMVRDLTGTEMKLCGKDKEAALEAKAKGNEYFSEGDFASASRFYSQALRVAPLDMNDKEKNLVATLYVNRASSFHKLGFFEESLRDCSRALKISPAYAKAWFRRGKANTVLGNLEDAINDLNVSIKLETSSSGKKQIQSELKLILDPHEQRSSRVERPNNGIPDDPLQIELQSIFTTNKGRGMTCFASIPEASLIHKEDPYAAIILKQCRETHCHFCFNELPPDKVPCVSCSTPFYCSTKCQLLAGGCLFSESESQYRFLENLADDLRDYVENVTSQVITSSNIEYAEHKHECHGVHWPAVLPSDVVLAGRVLVRFLQQQSSACIEPGLHGILDLCQNYEHLSNESKLEFHVYGVILLCCLQRFCSFKLPYNSIITSQIVRLLSQIRINSMAIVRVKCSNSNQPLDSVQQVRVAEAIYSGGSLFNHSCKPNVHAYFISRTLYIRATEHVTAGSHLELSYGPQVGQMDSIERRRVLQDRYSFICQCSCCSQLNHSDLVIHSYCCCKPNCFGVVMDSCTKYQKEKLEHREILSLLKDNVLHDDISRVASCANENSCDSSCLESSHCLYCGSHWDLQASLKILSQAEISIRRLQEAVASGEAPAGIITDALKSIDVLKTVLHPFNRKVAEVEDVIAQACCLAGALQDALNHCQASIKILEKLYGKDHIVIGNELVKLVSLKASMGHRSTGDDVNRLVEIFSRYYGPHTPTIFPHLPYFKKNMSSF